MVNKMFVKSRCPHCRHTLMPVTKINMNLPMNKRIDIIDSMYWENFGINVHPIMNKLKFDGYPTIFAEGFKISHSLSSDQLKSFLDGFFEGDKIIAEQPEFARRNHG